jgi:polar amino acid transport system permease protein
VTPPAPDVGPSRREVRAAAAKRRGRQRAAISVVSSAVVIGALVALVVTSPGWKPFSDGFLDGAEFRAAFPDILKGFWLDIKLFLIVEACVLALGLGLALIRSSRSPALFPARLLGVVYVDLFRGLPVVLVVYMFGFGVAALEIPGLPTSAVFLGGVAFVLCYTAYVAEVFRAGIDSVHPAQRSAALALGLTPAQSLRHVVLPQAIRRVTPPLLNDFISLQKDVALVSLLGPVDAFRQAQIASASHFNYTPLLGAALCYLVVTIPMARYVDYLQKRSRYRTVGGTA